MLRQYNNLRLYQNANQLNWPYIPKMRKKTKNYTP